MNRAFKPGPGQLEARSAMLYFRATIGAAGAVTIDADNSKGVASVVRSAAGRYTVTLEDTYAGLLGAPSLCLETTSVTATDGHQAVLRSEAVLNATPTLVISTLRTDTSAEADPASGAVLRATIDLKCTSV